MKTGVHLGNLIHAVCHIVGLSMICYTKAQKIIESSLRRDPVKRAHGKVIVFTKMDDKLSFEVVEGVKRMSCVKVLIILAV